jgi:hypothetical protein
MQGERAKKGKDVPLTGKRVKDKDLIPEIDAVTQPMLVREETIPYGERKK